MIFTTRFAPSPTGPLHLGHAYSALFADALAQQNNGRFLLRIEDIDQSRARQEWEQQIFDDLSWLGLSWDRPVLRQSGNLPRYRAALEALWSRGLLFVCHCNRRDIEQAAAAPQEGAPLTGPDGLIYPGTCRDLPRDTRAPLPSGKALRLDLRAAARHLPPEISFEEKGKGSAPQRITCKTEDVAARTGDVVLCRRDMGTSYHLSVVLDDAMQEITDVVRGEDLFDATVIHVVLQHLLDLPVPVYHHHRLIRDDAGKRLAKRDDARAISFFRSEGASPGDIRAMVGL
ncbi:tRNA glutamyl-Q(34) synthetase GluQRS [uncultured Roseobacter sp.]|uniref:tRNA glutamyl-Q(34) synthetase GluQRS n=1 Tax=uncultured Roseobacter sp. TaxID=114847 RepID=UPI0026356682|nr:tRNA glutamyl-Q(34) synthetase GluQRS [uncultured Roseobacter sp.]